MKLHSALPALAGNVPTELTEAVPADVTARLAAAACLLAQGALRASRSHKERPSAAPAAGKEAVPVEADETIAPHDSIPSAANHLPFHTE